MPFGSLALFGRSISPATLRPIHLARDVATGPSFLLHRDRPILPVASRPPCPACGITTTLSWPLRWCEVVLGSENRKSVWIARFLRLGIVVSLLDRNPRHKTAGNHLNSGSFLL